MSFLLLLSGVLLGQEEKPLTSDSTTVVITLDDSTQSYASGDSILVDSTTEKSSTEDIEYTINYSAEDSIKFDVKSQIMYLYGDSHVDYGTKKLDSERMEINWGDNTVLSTFSEDTTGKKVGIPKFDDNGDIYYADTIMYNTKSEVGYITGIETKQSEGYLRGERSLKAKDNTIYVENGEYCPCDDPDAKTAFRTRRIKVVPEGKVYTGPGIMYIEDVPTPLVLPFGVFPSTNSKSSGILPPSPGEDATYGYFLQNFGYYWAVNDYVGATFLGDYYSKGRWGYSADIEYKNRYSYNGNFFYKFQELVQDGDGFNRQEDKTFDIRWKHSPVSYTGRKLTANVNLSSTNSNRLNETNYTKNITSTAKSNISYTYPVRKTPFTVTTNLRHEQNNETGIYNFNLPDVAIAMSQVKPFTSKKTGTKSKLTTLTENTTFTYNSYFKNNITNNFNNIFTNVSNAPEDTILPFKSENLSTIFDNTNYGMNHNINISSAMKMGPLNMSPSFRYQETWFPNKYDYTFQQSDSAVYIDTVGNFSRANDWSAALSFNSRAYGTFSFKGERQKKIRHTIAPRVGLSYSPDKQSNNNNFQNIQTDINGSYERASRYKGNVFSTPGGNESASVNFGLVNDVDMKYYSLKDTSGKAKYLKLIESLSATSSYNFIADSFNLSNFNLGANTSVIKGISVRWTATVDPYTYRLDSINGNGEVIEQKRMNEFAWNNSQGIGRLSLNQFNISGTFSPRTFESFKKEQEQEEYEERLERTNGYYVDFTIPWSFRFNYSYSIRRTGFQDPTKTRSLTLGGDIKVSDYWKVEMTTAYDFESKKFVSPRINIYRDLNCWEFNVFWVPYGQVQRYEFRINMKPTALKDLKLRKERNIRDF